MAAAGEVRWRRVTPSEHGFGLMLHGRRELSCSAMLPWQPAAFRALTYDLGPQQGQFGGGRAQFRQLASNVVPLGSAATL